MIILKGCLHLQTVYWNPGEDLTTAGGGIFVRSEVSRNKRSVPWTVATIEAAVRRYMKCDSHFCESLLESGGDLLSRTVTSQVPSALKGLTSVFGKGTGGTPSSLPPEMVSLFSSQPGSVAFASAFSPFWFSGLPIFLFFLRPACGAFTP